MSLELRRHIEEIVSLTGDEFEFVMQHFKQRKLEKHQFLIHEGEYVRNNHWIIKGLFRAYFIDRKGKEYILQFGTEGRWITDYQAYIDESKASLNVVCIEPAEILSLSLQNQEKLCADLHKMEHFFRVKSNLGFVALLQRILSLMSKSAEERYEQLLNRYPGLVQRVPKKYIAAYLGVSRETLSRLKSLH